MHRLLLPGLFLVALTVPSALGEDGFVPLFDGKSLAGWKKVGGSATYRVEGDQVVGVVDPASKENTFLRTERTYGDFVLRLDLKLDTPGNSGIQFRSHQRSAKDGNGRVFGYQCEVDPSKRAWTGGLYDEARRAWLVSLDGHPEAQKAFRVADWNRFEVEAIGPHLKLSVNGILCADYLDTMDLDGFIALQVHAGKEGVIRWRNVRIKDLGVAKWTPLLERASLDGWKPTGGGGWTREQDEIVGHHAQGDPVHGHLVSSETYGDFALKLKFQSVQGNSGLYFRSEEGGEFGILGFQAEIDPSHDVGGLYETGGRGWVVQPRPAEVKKWLKPNGWNDLSVVALGDRVVVHVNGYLSAEIGDATGRKRGKLALQLHGGQEVNVRFKEIAILPLDPTK